MATLAFLARELNLRGTSVAVYDYAAGAQDHLGHRAAILIDEAGAHEALAVERFRRRFEIVAYRGLGDVDRALDSLRADFVHVLKGDGRDRWTARAAPTGVHQVFPAWGSDAHGSAYAYVSGWLARACGGRRAPFVPHIVALPGPSGDLRAELGLAADALVVGCHGGAESFDLDFARRALARALDARGDLHFLGLNLTPFLAHPRARFLPGVADPAHKRRVIDTCDAMLHARRRGETFGLAVAEFSACNRPVLTWSGSPERAHLEMLGDAALTYRGERDLTRLLLRLDRRELQKRDWDRYSRDYAAPAAMARFDEVFLSRRADPARLRAGWVGPDELSLSGVGRYLRRLRRRLRGKSP